MVSKSSDHKFYNSPWLGAAFLMATSAIGPGFITQTTVFTEKLLADFAFVIVCSIILDVVVQLTIWRIIIVSGLPAQQLANRVLPGAGHFLSGAVVLGGLAFNIGNLAGAALGLQILFQLELWWGVVISAGLGVIIFWFREVAGALDKFTKILGVAMIAVMLYMVVKSDPPVLLALRHSVAPDTIDTTAIIVLVGGTVGGYISFAGAHRLLQSGLTGTAHLKKISYHGVTGIVLASVMRVLLFLAALGVCWAGTKLNGDNPAASVFSTIAGNSGLKFFGLVLWAAAITSVVGSAFTSVSFLIPTSTSLRFRVCVSLFIVISAMVFLLIGKPVKVLVIAGALNAFILPVALALMLFAAKKRDLVGSYNHPWWLTLSACFVIAILTWMSVTTVWRDMVSLWIN